MATPTTLSQALEILNETYEKLGMKRDENDIITAENLHTYAVNQPSMINKIIEQMQLILQQRTFRALFDAERNRMRVFNVDLSKNGFGILDVFTKFASPMTPMWDSSYNDADRAEDRVAFDPATILRKYHTNQIQTQFKVSYDIRNYEKIFTASGLTSFIDDVVANLAASAEYWLFNQAVAELRKAGNNGDAVYVNGVNLNDTNGVHAAIETIRSTAEGMMLIDNKYNKDGVTTLSESKDNLYLITTPQHMERLRNRVFAGAYNLSETDLPFNTIYVPNGTDLGKDTTKDEDILFWLIDRRMLVIGIKTWIMTSEFAPNTLWTKYWLSIDGISSHNTFFNAVAFTGDFGNFQ